MGLWEGLRRGTRAFGKALAEGPEPFQYMAGDVRVVCHHCGYDRFHENRYRLGASLACHHCGLIQWFAKKPRRVEAGPKSVKDGALD